MRNLFIQLVFDLGNPDFSRIGWTVGDKYGEFYIFLTCLVRIGIGIRTRTRQKVELNNKLYDVCNKNKRVGSLKVSSWMEDWMCHCTFSCFVTVIGNVHILNWSFCNNHTNSSFKGNFMASSIYYHILHLMKSKLLNFITNSIVHSYVYFTFKAIFYENECF